MSIESDNMVTKAEYIGEYKIMVYFEDGQTRLIDLKDFLESTPVKLAKRFLDLNLFRQFRVDDGTLCWGDNEMDINPMNIYNGKYDAVMDC